MNNSRTEGWNSHGHARPRRISVVVSLVALLALGIRQFWGSSPG